VTPGPGQQSVWDYPRPPRVEPSTSLVELVLGGETVASTRQALRVLETSHPPAYYLPRNAFVPGALRPAAGTSYCEFKGTATYVDVVARDVIATRAGWHYPQPTAGFEQLRDHVAIYPAAMDRCSVDGEIARPQEGGFYGGWITRAVVGPFKGAPGSSGW
jgi:uncharacterized protein (DUF427 family)